VELLPVSIGFGLVVSLLLAETLGVAAAGMVVPGYLALALDRPKSVLVLLSAATLSYALMRLASTFLVVFGRRRTALALLIGYPVGALFSRWFLADAEPAEAAIGYILPGLIAIWMDRQGLVSTLSALTICSVIVRFFLLLAFGHELIPRGYFG
jgi:gamma-polyglutamate biosynthesis protein CapC